MSRLLRRIPARQRLGVVIRLVYAEAAFAVIDPELLRFLPARTLVDERGFAKTLIERVDALDKKGPR